MNSNKISADEGKHMERDQETRRRILTVAERLFLAKGFKGVSMKDIADKVDVTTAALYYHFPEGKQELFLSMIQQAIEDWGEQAFHEVNQVKGLRQQLLVLTQHTLSRHLNNFFALSRDVEEFCRDNSRKRELMISHRKGQLQRVTALFQQAIDSGEITQEIPANLLALMYEGMTMGVQFGRHFFAADIEQRDTQELATMVVQSFLDGITNQAKR
jgi:AcrR family transcriptional regulator